MDAYNGPIRDSVSWHRDGCEHTRTRTVSRPAPATTTSLNGEGSTVHIEEIRHDIRNPAQRQHHVQLKSQQVRVRYDGLLVHIQWHTAFERAVKPTPDEDTDRPDGNQNGDGNIIAQESWHNELTLDLRPLLTGSGAPIDSIPMSLPAAHPSSPPTAASNANPGNVAPSFASGFTAHAHAHPPVPLMLTAAHPRHRKPAGQSIKPTPGFIVEEVSSDEEPDRAGAGAGAGPYPRYDSPEELSDQDTVFVSQRSATSTRRPVSQQSSHRRPPKESARKRSRDIPAIDADALHQRIASLEQQLSQQSRHDGQDGGREKSRKRGGAREKRRKTATWASDSD